MFQNIISQSEHKFESKHLSRNKQKMRVKNYKRKTNFFWKVCNALSKIFYCICKYFMMWDVQYHSVTPRSRNDWKVGAFSGRKNEENKVFYIPMIVLK